MPPAVRGMGVQELQECPGMGCSRRTPVPSGSAPRCLAREVWLGGNTDTCVRCPGIPCVPQVGSRRTPLGNAPRRKDKGKNSQNVKLQRANWQHRLFSDTIAGERKRERERERRMEGGRTGERRWRWRQSSRSRRRERRRKTGWERGGDGEEGGKETAVTPSTFIRKLPEKAERSIF